jgi:hypothetical protein
MLCESSPCPSAMPPAICDRHQHERMASKRTEANLPANVFELRVCVVGRGGDKRDQVRLESHELGKEIELLLFTAV